MGTSTSRQIRDSSNVFGGIFVWILGIIFLVQPLFLFLSREQHGSKKPPPLWGALWGAAIFGIGGLLLLWLAIYTSIRLAKYGRSIFESPWLPATCGGILTGTVRIPRPFLYREPIHLRLACVKVFGTRRDSHEDLLWEDFCTLDRFSPGTAVSEIPVYFKIPGDAQPTGTGGIFWRLQAKAKTAGVHYSAMFVVPVTSGEAPAELLAMPDPTLALRSPEPARRQPLDRHLHFNPLPGGGGQFELLPGRNLGMSSSSILFGAVFIGIGTTIMQLAARDVPIWFPLIFIAAGALMALGGLWLLFLKTTINVRHGVITIENTLASMNRQKEIRAADISDISSKFQGQSMNRPFYSIAATRLNGGNVKICGTIHDKGDADWLTAEMKRELAGR